MRLKLYRSHRDLFITITIAVLTQIYPESTAKVSQANKKPISDVILHSVDLTVLIPSFNVDCLLT